MAKARALRSHKAALSGWRLALVHLLIGAFLLQSYVLQTHIHFPHSAGVSHALKADSQDRQDRFPAGDDPANCPLCQEILHSGQFVTPSAQALLPPALAVSTIAVVDQALPFIAALSHSWRGRAPPTR